MSSSSSSSYCWWPNHITVWTILRVTLLSVAALVSWHALNDPDFVPKIMDGGGWRYFARWMGRCIRDPPETPFAQDDQNILFIGNSYTGYYELDQLTQAVMVNGQQQQQQRQTEDPTSASSSSSPWDTATINVESHFPGGQTFQGHWKGLTRPPFLGKHHVMHKWLVSNADIRHWKWIFLQNHSLQGGMYQSPDSKRQETYQQSLQAAQEMIQVIRQHNPSAQFCFFMTWGRRKWYRGIPKEYKDFLTMQDLTAQGYQHYVHATSNEQQQQTYLAPVGLVFATIYRDDAAAAGNKDPSQDPTTLFYQLLDYEGHHPALPGSYAAAVTFYETLTGKDATQLTWAPPKGVTHEQAVRIREAVHRTIQDTARQGIIRYPWQEQTTNKAEESTITATTKTEESSNKNNNP
ncbi:expressed unknown protein [Seminavis robusta]|uniref:Uncharacterized protein n=1 Tax=Seminavis robusta TaxID=568900 RepID=A0A9N8F201_9STRA|nr:expressed unknown protein [Seminavis robusta]|eukprot:Sro3511_g348760.1 n/a (406) ;mRNA; r:4781-5998